MAKFGEIIRVLRIKRGFSQEKLAKKIGISRSALANYECGLREPNLDTIEMFADFFDVSTDDLMGRMDDAQPPANNQPRKWRMLSSGSLTLTDEQIDKLYNVARAMFPENFPSDE